MSEQNDVIRVGTDTTASELEELINGAPAGATLELEAGHYLLDDAITITRSDVTLTGAGSGQTTLTFSDTALARNDDYGIRVDGSERETVGRLSLDHPEGTQRLTLDGDHDLAPGDSIRVWQDNDDALFDEIGDTSWRKVQYAELRTSMARVEAVDGNDITLDRGLHFDFEGGQTRVERLDTADGVTLTGFSIDFELGTPDNAVFENTLGELTGYQAVVLDGTVDARLADIQVLDGPSKAFHFARSLDIDATDLQAHGAFNKGSGGNGYAYELRESYDGTFGGLEDSGMRHGLLFDSWRSSVGNDIEVAFTDRDINFHGGLDHDNSMRVEQSIRDPDADLMSPTLWVNAGGESFGAITDADANEVVFDYVIGSRRDDSLQGSDDGVFLGGGLGHDTLVGGDGNDLLQGGPGDDWYDGEDRLEGGKGTDTALYTQDYDHYDIAFADDHVVIEGKGSIDTLVDMQYAVFGDGTTLHLASGNAFQGEPAAPPSPKEILDGDGMLPGLIDDDTDLVVTGNTTSIWSTGHVAEIFIENASDREIIDPEVRFDLAADIDTLWNGELSRDDGGYRVTDDAPQVLEPGEAWRFAFKAYGDDSSLPDRLEAEASGSQLQVQLLGLGDAAVDDMVG
ncbi:alginate biosynthesis protein [Halomonas sp. EGI 63088]|uniref:Alginate biosynthesis protein n=1 Tax=Halomonas flagellata TaxID=2920385 RepID=A0ABS9RRY1_9GAMM|nr:alginate biosynthesis protein [Halomonas flagellata]MCH4562623.1 alginate biosynthesis protein [Halomonas flagellata]